MKSTNLKKHFLIPFLIMLLILGSIVALFYFHLIRKEVVQRAQSEVAQKLNTVRIFILKELSIMEESLFLVSKNYDSATIKTMLNFDYCSVVPIVLQDTATMSPYVKVAAHGVRSSGLRIVSSHELSSYVHDPAVYTIPLMHSNQATSSDEIVRDVMVLEVAVPVFNDTGDVLSVYYGGKILNKNFDFIDKVHDLVFGDDSYHDRPYGTVTIFQNDTRIATNVVTVNHERAVGTRVSQSVYDAVLGRGDLWIDRAFVVNEWYLTAYEPIRTIDNEIIGILYVGILEQPFTDLALRSFGVFFIVFVLAGVCVFIVTYVLEGLVLKPLSQMIATISTISQGNLSAQVDTNTGITELNQLADAFNAMTNILKERQMKLETANESLAILNQNYVDLIGFVAHELKGVIGSTLMSAYTVRDGFLGEINPPQKKSLDLVIRNLDYLTSTIRSFLNLNTIEKGELSIDWGLFKIKEDVIDSSINIFKAAAQNKGIEIQNMISPGIIVKADRDLIQIVANNLIGNAIKYGNNNGHVVIRARPIHEKSKVEIEVYNDSIPLTTEDNVKLFKKFSRVIKDPTKKVKGTGLGLFISREIIERHSMRIWHETRSSGNVFKFELPLSD
jgi:two-component system NtrC family sensor kinase